MNLNEWVKQKHGRAVTLARGVNVSAPTVANWVSGKCPVPEKRCVQIERFTSGEVSRADLRPDDFWLIWPDLTAPSNPPAAQA